MTITYWTNFVKRKNSTLVPSGTGTDLTVTLKEGTSIEKPTFILTGNLFTCNYVQAFDHYYFVDDIRSVRNNLSEIECSMDVLATFKTDIGNYTALIERSATYYDTTYPDTAVAMKNDVVTNENQAASSMFVSGGGYGCYVLSVLNDIGSGTGFTTTYILDASELAECAQFVNTDWGSAETDIVAWLKAVFLKTADSIIDCIWLPVASSVYTSSSLVVYETLRIGVTNMQGTGLDVKGYRITYPFIATESITLTIPHWYSDFRKYNPFTKVILKIPGMGATEINPLDFEKNSTIKLVYWLDMSTGDAFVAACNDDGHLVSTYSLNIAVQCPVGKIGADVTGFMTSGLATAAAAAGALVAPGKYQAVSGFAAAATAMNTLASMTGVTASIHGGKGGRAIFRDANYYVGVIAKYTSTPSDLSDEAGRPCMAKYQISTCSGFVKCVNADVPIAGMGGEKEIVNEYLNGGFYYE